MSRSSQVSTARAALFCDTALAARIEAAEADLIARAVLVRHPDRR
jgi:hypothetical protein